MSLAVLYSRALSGMEATLITVEVHLANGLPDFTVVGLPKESGRFDLPIALGILATTGQIPTDKLADYEYAGELAVSAIPALVKCRWRCTWCCFWMSMNAVCWKYCGSRWSPGKSPYLAPRAEPISRHVSN